MAGKDFIPGTDAELTTFLNKFLSAILADPAGFGLTQAEVTAFQTLVTARATSVQTQATADAAALHATQEKIKASDLAVASARGLVKKINGHPAADNAMRAKAGLPEHDEVRTAIGAPTTKPIGRIESSGHSTLVIHFVDETTPKRSAKPHGVAGCQIWTHVGDPAPVEMSGYTFLALDTKTPYTDEHQGADAGKTVYYALRWVSTKHEPGPWGDVLSAKIPL